MTPPSEEMKSMMVKAVGERNDIDCSFDTGKKVYPASDIWAKISDTPRCRTGMRYFVKDVMKSLIVLYLVLTELWRIVIVVVTMSDYVCHPLLVTKYYYGRPCFNKRWLIPTSSR